MSFVGVSKVKWRSLGIYRAPAGHIHASQEVLTKSVGLGHAPPTIRIVIYEPPAVTLGCNQSVEEEVNLDKLRELGFEVMRRPTGGGAVLMTGPEGPDDAPGWEVYVPENLEGLPGEIDESFEYLSRPAVEFLRMLGLKANFRYKNDIEVGGKKIAGVGQYRDSGGILHTGTFLLDFDVKLMLSVLKIPFEKISDKAIKSVEGRLTTVKRELGFKPSAEKLLELFEKAVEKAFNVEVFRGKLNDYEEKEFKKMLEKYYSEEWIYGLRPTMEYTSILTKKTPGGLIRVHVKVSDNAIESIMFTGDFFIYPEKAIYDLEAYLKWSSIDEESVRARICEFFEKTGAKILGLAPEELADLVVNCISKASGEERK